jgi:hypothetical protein
MTTPNFKHSRFQVRPNSFDGNVQRLYRWEFQSELRIVPYRGTAEERRTVPDAPTGESSSPKKLDDHSNFPAQIPKQADDQDKHHPQYGNIKRKFAPRGPLQRSHATDRLSADA